MAAAADRQISCLFVRFNTTLFFTFVRSFGTLTNAIKSHAGATYPLQAAQFSDFLLSSVFLQFSQDVYKRQVITGMFPKFAIANDSFSLIFILS